MKIKKIIVEILKMKKLNKTIKIVEDDYLGDYQPIEMTHKVSTYMVELSEEKGNALICIAKFHKLNPDYMIDLMIEEELKKIQENVGNL